MRISMNKVLIRKSLIHLYTAIGFAVLSVIFYSPLLDGKKLYQSDINQYEAMSREIQENRENIPDEVYWIDNAFGGMPTFQLGAKFAYDILSPFHLLFRFIPRPAHTLFLYLLTMYILLMVLKIPWRIAILGSVAFAFSTYLLIILQVGHNTKALAIAYIPLVVAGLVLLRQNKLLPGFLVSLLGISLQIRANHYQMTYYMLILLGIYVIVYLIDSYRKKDLKEYLKYIGIFALAGILSLGLNAPNILSTYDYSKYSTRSQSELKLNPDGTEKELSTGLDYDYITQYSYGILESINLIAPRVQGGASSEDIGRNSDLYKFLVDNNVPRKQADSFVSSVPTYWGDQPILEKVIEIGKKNNLEFIEGPVGFSNMDKAGMLIKGFEKKNTMITMYNYSYYQDHMKSHGYSKLAEWVEYELKIANYDDSPEKVKKFSDLILKRYNLKKLNFTSTDQIVPYVDQMFYLLGKTYDKLQTFVPIQEYQIDYYKNRFLKYINPGFIKCVADENDELVAFAITMPSFSNALKKIKGKVDLIGKLRLLHAKNFNSKGSLYLIGVRPDFQNKGVIAILFNELQKFYNKFGITEVETNPELIENTAIQQLWKNYENNQHKNRATFTKQI